MRVLGIDASGPALAVALIEKETVLAEFAWAAPRTAGAFLVAWVKEITQQFGWPDGIGVGIGPGSFTGTRIAVSAAKMLAWARGLPVAGVSSLAAWAAAAPPSTLVVVTSERRGPAFYLGLFRIGDAGPEPAIPEQAVDGELPAPFPLGEAAWLVGPMAGDEAWRPRFGSLVTPHPLPLYASNVARLAERRLAAGQADPVEQLLPRYLRPPAIQGQGSRGA
jgi:tRNA threonylcarbamoyladenosine biosynthesis protein TsaB